MPTKDAASAVDRLSPTAEALGAVNTVVAREGELVGDNTDGDGLVGALRVDQGFDPARRRCLVVGAGGAARAVVRALAEAGGGRGRGHRPDAGPPRTAAALAPGVGRVGGPADAAEADLIVNATPVGMGGDGGLPLDPALLNPGQLVVDLVYHPALTPFVVAALERGRHRGQRRSACSCTRRPGPSGCGPGRSRPST